MKEPSALFITVALSLICFVHCRSPKTNRTTMNLVRYSSEERRHCLFPFWWCTGHFSKLIQSLFGSPNWYSKLIQSLFGSPNWWCTGDKQTKPFFVWESFLTLPRSLLDLILRKKSNANHDLDSHQVHQAHNRSSFLETKFSWLKVAAQPQ